MHAPDASRQCRFAQIAFTINVAERTESLRRLSDSMYAGLSVDEQLSMPDGEDLTDLPYLLDDDGDGEGENDEDDESRRLNWHDLLEMASTSQRVRRGLANRFGTVNLRRRVQARANVLDRRAAFDRLSGAIDEVSSEIKDVRYLELCNAAKACFDACTSGRDTLLVDDLMNAWVAAPDPSFLSA